jgi:hypothetical protein
MKPTSRRIALVGLLAACSVAAQAQTAAPPAGAAPMGMQEHGQPHGHFDPARMQERMQRRMDRLKRILQITPAQEGAWSAWAAAMRPSPEAMQHMREQRGHRDEIARMTTPERIDRMRQMRAQRAAEMDRRGDATKTFYAQLTPSQQKAFDEISLGFFGRGHGRRHG